MKLDNVRLHLENILSLNPLQRDKTIKNLITEIDVYIQKEKDMESLQDVFNTLSVYENRYLITLDEFNALDHDQVFEKSHKVQDILTNLSFIEAYLINILNRTYIKNNSIEGSKLYKRILELKEKKTFYKNAQYAWVSIIKSLSIEINVIHTNEQDAKKASCIDIE